MFDPRPTKYPFPLDTGSHYLVVKKNNGLIFDEKYPYIDKSAKMKFRQGLLRLLLYFPVFPIMTVRLGLKIRGKENLKKHRKELEGGVISVCNHVHLWDYIAIMKAAARYKTNILAWAKNIRGENGALIRLVGGIPVPEKDPHATAAMVKAVSSLLANGGWLHIYAEGSMWEYYQPIRPFKPGAAYFACKFGKPVLPFAFSYRRPGFIRKKIFRQQALFTLNIGEPIYANLDLPKGAREKDLTVRCHEAVCRLAGIEPAENKYPPVYDEKVVRVDYY